jgi:hypothetical protein
MSGLPQEPSAPLCAQYLHLAGEGAKITARE